MKKFGRTTILDVLDRAKKEFIGDPDALYSSSFYYRGHFVLAFCDPVPNDSGWFVESFKVVYSRCVMIYELGVDYDWDDAFFDD